MSNILKNYLRFWAKLYLKRVKPQIIAVTGSAGKTSAKEAIFDVLETGLGNAVRRSEGNLNTIYGVSLAILGYRKPPVPLDQPFSIWPWIPVIFSAPFKIWTNSQTKYLILEIAADKPGDIEYITNFVKPTISVVTNIGPAHLEIFGSLQKIIEEKTQILRALKPDGFGVLNIDDENLAKIEEEDWKMKKIGLINISEADFTAKNITTEIIDYSPVTKFQVVTGKIKFQAETHTLGREANIYPSLIAVAIGEILSLKTSVIIDGLKRIRPLKHRMEVFKGKNGSVIIDDAYNSNPISLKAALNTFKVLPAKRKIIVLGDMLELGKITVDSHKLMGQYAREISEEVYSFGPKAKDFGANRHFENKPELIEFLLNKIATGDIILIKASRGMKFEEIVDSLKF